MSFAAEQQETSLDVNPAERQRNAVHTLLLIPLPLLHIADNDRFNREQLPDFQHIGVVGMRNLNDRFFQDLVQLRLQFNNRGRDATAGRDTRQAYRENNGEYTGRASGRTGESPQH